MKKDQLTPSTVGLLLFSGFLIALFGTVIFG